MWVDVQTETDWEGVRKGVSRALEGLEASARRGRTPSEQ